MSPAKIQDEFSGVNGVANRYKLRHIRRGLCSHCPKPRVTALHCRECADKHNLIVKKTYKKSV